MTDTVAMRGLNAVTRMYYASRFTGAGVSLARGNSNHRARLRPDLRGWVK